MCRKTGVKAVFKSNGSLKEDSDECEDEDTRNIKSPAVTASHWENTRLKEEDHKAR